MPLTANKHSPNNLHHFRSWGGFEVTCKCSDGVTRTFLIKPLWVAPAQSDDDQALDKCTLCNRRFFPFRFFSPHTQQDIQKNNKQRFICDGHLVSTPHMIEVAKLWHSFGQLLAAHCKMSYIMDARVAGIARYWPKATNQSTWQVGMGWRPRPRSLEARIIDGWAPPWFLYMLSHMDPPMRRVEPPPSPPPSLEFECVD